MSTATPTLPAVVNDTEKHSRIMITAVRIMDVAGADQDIYFLYGNASHQLASLTLRTTIPIIVLITSITSSTKSHCHDSSCNGSNDIELK